MDFLLNIQVDVYPTEDTQRILDALLKIFPDISFTVMKNEITGKSENYHDLEKLRKKIHEQRIIDSARLAILSSSNDSLIRFSITKQHIILGTIHFCDSDTEPPLGCVNIEIYTDKIERFIDWFTPRTQDGKIIDKVDFE